jgi:hypothetical protein
MVCDHGALNALGKKVCLIGEEEGKGQVKMIETIMKISKNDCHPIFYIHELSRIG